MVRLTFVTMLVILAVVASFVSRCEQKSTAGARMIRLVAIFVPVTALTGASRNKRIAGGRLVQDRLTYPWIVSINSIYTGETSDGTQFENEFRCTGSFIDIYGSILTAGHCFKKRIYCREMGTYCNLAHALISFGSTSPELYQDIGDTALISVSRIKRFKLRGLKRRKGKIDLALMFPHQFDGMPMTAPEALSTSRPIKLTRVIEPIQPSIPDGTLIGFGAQPVMFNQTAWSYTDENPLREISMQFRGYFRKVCGVRINPFWRARLLFGARAIFDQPTDQAEQLPPMYRGSCLARTLVTPGVASPTIAPDLAQMATAVDHTW